MAAIGKWLIHTVLGWAVQYLWPLLVKWATGLVSKWQRSRKQDAAQKKQDENVEQGKPRTEETKKDEETWLNS